MPLDSSAINGQLARATLGAPEKVPGKAGLWEAQLRVEEIVAAVRDPSLRLGGFSDFLGPPTAIHSGASHGAMPNRSVMP